MEFLNAYSKFQSSITISFYPPGIVFTLPAKTIIMRSVAEISSRLKLGKKANYFKPSLCWTNLNFNAFFRKLDHFSSWIWRKFGFLCTFRAGIRLNLCKLSLKMYVLVLLRQFWGFSMWKRGINAFKRSLNLFTEVHGSYTIRVSFKL